MLFKYLFAAKREEVRVLRDYGLDNTSFAEIGQLRIRFVRRHEAVDALGPSSLWQRTRQCAGQRPETSRQLPVPIPSTATLHTQSTALRTLLWGMLFLLLARAYTHFTDHVAAKCFKNQSIHLEKTLPYTEGVSRALTYKPRNLIFSNYRKLPSKEWLCSKSL